MVADRLWIGIFINGLKRCRFPFKNVIMLLRFHNDYVICIVLIMSRCLCWPYHTVLAKKQAVQRNKSSRDLIFIYSYAEKFPRSVNVRPASSAACVLLRLYIILTIFYSYLVYVILNLWYCCSETYCAVSLVKTTPWKFWG